MRILLHAVPYHAISYHTTPYRTIPCTMSRYAVLPCVTKYTTLPPPWFFVYKSRLFWPYVPYPYQSRKKKNAEKQKKTVLLFSPEKNDLGARNGERNNRTILVTIPPKRTQKKRHRVRCYFVHTDRISSVRLKVSRQIGICSSPPPSPFRRKKNRAPSARLNPWQETEIPQNNKQNIRRYVAVRKLVFFITMARHGEGRGVMSTYQGFVEWTKPYPTHTPTPSAYHTV